MKRIIAIVLFMSVTFYSKAQNSKFVGIWKLVAVENVAADSSITYPYGKEPTGRLIFDKSGDYSLHILKPGRPNIVSGSKNAATTEENVFMVQGYNGHFGKFETNAKEHKITFKVEQAFFPNWGGKDLSSTYALEGKLFKNYSKNTTFGGSSVVVIWEKVK